MGLTDTDLEKKAQEDQITESLFSCIDERQSLVFNAGAGAGKTYALVECLRYVIKQYGQKLEEHNQQIMCITYTNVAANHVKESIGNSNLVRVSTIHERLWQLIQPYQKELLDLHKEKLKEKIADDIRKLTDESIKDAKVYKTYRELSAQNRAEFEEIILAHKEEFYQGYSLKADEFRSFYGGYVQEYPTLLKSVDNFREIVSKVYEKKRYEECLSQIEQKASGYRKVEYNAIYNRDQLHRMRISHDTLLEYGEKLVSQYPILQQIIIDQYPYIFIDEYQDTAEEVVNIMAVLDCRGKAIGHDVFIGYYGDPVQNIYDDGIGSRLFEKHSGLKEIRKQFNRRSYEEIINVANEIRLDGMQQESIYTDCKGGTVEYCSEDFDTVIEKCRAEWKIEKDKTIHCFLLRNEDVARKTGISNIYDVFKSSKAYTGSNFKQLNTELLSNDLKKLGQVPSFLYRVLKLYMDIREEETPVEEVLYGDINMYSSLHIAELKNIKQQLKEISGDTLKDLLNKMCACYERGDKNVQIIIKNVLDLEQVNYHYIIGFLMQTLEQKRILEEDQKEEEEKDEDESLDRIKKLLAIDLKEYEKWFNYIERKGKYEIIYHTYHGTKGLEFENVLIVLEDGSGTSREDKVFIKCFLENYALLGSEQSVEQYEKARNLLYVAVTRAKKNLKLIYGGESENVKKTLNAIFNEKKDDE